jgi:putative ABC transport system permease protein
MSRPLPRTEELEMIQRKSSGYEVAAFLATANKTLSFESNVAENTQITAVSEDYQQLRSFEIEKGRFISSFEFNGGRPVVVIGSELSRLLFGKLNPVGSSLKMDGRKMTVIGVFAREGDNMFFGSADYMAVVPALYMKKYYNIESDEMNPLIMVKAKSGVDNEELMAELNSIMRAVRRIRPAEEENFALNQSSMLTQGFEELFKVIDLAGLVIGGFSILVGGFGIANIMFVSVKERTKLIGIQKSLGAKNYMILTQFLTESVALSLMGGIAGLILIFLGTLFLSQITDMSFALTAGNIISGVTISVFIGIVSGFAPALSASRLDPVVAINSNF